MLNSNILSTPALRFQEALSKVFHDATLYGDGTRSNPLRVVGGGGGGSIPDQTGHSGEFLTTDGSNLSWDSPVNFTNAAGGFDFASTTGGLVVPRMTTLQRDAIVTTVDGTIIYESDVPQFSVWDNGGWSALVSGSYLNGWVGGTSIDTLGTITSGTWNATPIQLAYGGTNANLAASNGGIFYSTATAGAILSGTATANKMLLSGATAAPSWSTSTIPTSAGATAGKVLVSDATNYVLSNTLFLDSGITTSADYTVGNSTNALLMTVTGNNLFTLANTHNISTSAQGLAIGGNGLTLTQTSGTRRYMNFNYNFSPTSGTAVHSSISFSGTVNQTGGANGIVRRFYDESVLTAVADYRVIDIAINTANAKGIYQSGTATSNILAGKTTHGSTTAPTALVMLAAGTTSANTAPLKFTSGTNLTTPEAGAVEFDGTNYFVTSSSTRYTLAKTLTATATLDFPNTIRLNSSDLTISVPGAAVGDAVILGTANASVVTDGIFTAWVSAADTVTVRFTNVGLTLDRDPASGTFRVSVLKY